MLKQIKYFQTVVHCGSFTKAADKSFISQSAISQHIKNLEKELGVLLLKRENRGFSLTPAGEYFYRKSLILLNDLDQLTKEVKQIERGDNFVLKFGHLKNDTGSEFKKAIAEFTQKYPNIPIEIKSGNHEELYELLRTNEADLVLNDQRRAFSDEYNNTVLSTVDSFIEIFNLSPIAKMDKIEIKELKNLPCILVAEGSQKEIEEDFFREIYGIENEIIFADTVDDARLLVLSNQGFLPVFGGSLSEEYHDKISRIPLYHNKKPFRRNFCAFNRIDNSGFLIEEFIDILKSQFNKEI